jgi:hypothetical protein
VPGTTPSIRSRASLLSSLTEEIADSLRLAQFPAAPSCAAAPGLNLMPRTSTLATGDSANAKLLV